MVRSPSPRLVNVFLTKLNAGRNAIYLQGKSIKSHFHSHKNTTRLNKGLFFAFPWKLVSEENKAVLHEASIGAQKMQVETWPRPLTETWVSSCLKWRSLNAAPGVGGLPGLRVPLYKVGAGSVDVPFDPQLLKGSVSPASSNL